MPTNVHGIFPVGAGPGLPNRGLLLKQGEAGTAPTSRMLQWQEEALIELVDDGGDLGGLRVVGDHDDRLAEVPI